MIKDIFKKYDIVLEESEISKFKKFLEIFKEKNSQINLSAIRDDEWIIEKHFVDSVMLNIFLDFLEWDLENVKVADLWTWWGFPLIPLAIINKNVSFVWIDSVWKKLKAIDDFVKNLELKNVKTLNGRAEDIWQNMNYRESFDFVTSRATAYLPTLLEYAIPLLKVGWIFCAYKLEDKEELTASKKALQKLSTKILKVKNYEIDGQKRVIIFFEKLEKTNLKYPRKNWIPLQTPIK